MGVAQRGHNVHGGMASQVVQEAEPFTPSQDLRDGVLPMQQGQVEGRVTHTVPLQHRGSGSFTLHAQQAVTC